jgi:hypothetical protein
MSSKTKMFHMFQYGSRGKKRDFIMRAGSELRAEIMDFRSHGDRRLRAARISHSSGKQIRYD